MDFNDPFWTISLLISRMSSREGVVPPSEVLVGPDVGRFPFDSLDLFLYSRTSCSPGDNGCRMIIYIFISLFDCLLFWFWGVRVHLNFRFTALMLLLFFFFAQKTYYSAPILNSLLSFSFMAWEKKKKGRRKKEEKRRERAKMRLVFSLHRKWHRSQTRFIPHLPLRLAIDRLLGMEMGFKRHFCRRRQMDPDALASVCQRPAENK